jgi:phosphate-selective porin OprO/OprP
MKAKFLSLFFLIIAISSTSPLIAFGKKEALSLKTEAVNSEDEEMSKKRGQGIRVPLTGLHIYLKDGLHIDGRYEKIKFKIGGSIMVDAGAIDADNELDRAFPGHDDSDIDFRRFNIDMRGIFFDAIEFRLDIDFANVRDIKDNWIRFKNLPILNHMRFGHLKEPSSLEELTSIHNLTFMEQSLPTQALTPGRNLGVRYNNNFLGNRMTLALGGFWETSSFDSPNALGDRINENIGFDLSARITGLPLYAENGKKLIHLGLSYGHLFRDENRGDSNLRISTRPETRITDELLVDTGDLLIDGGERIGGEFAVVRGPLSFQGEYLYAIAYEEGNLNFWGYYLYGSYFLTGENRRYNRSNGTFTRTEPKHNFRPFKGGWGAWELGLRYSYLDLNSGDIKGGKETNFTVGLNWYLHPKIRFMFNYIRANVEDRDDPSINDGTADIFASRFQVVF